MNILTYSLILFIIFNPCLLITDKEANKYDNEFTKELDNRPVDVKSGCDGICD